MALAFVFIEKHASNQKPTMPYKSDAKHVIDATHSKLNLIIPMFKKCTFLSDFFLSTPNEASMCSICLLRLKTSCFRNIKLNSVRFLCGFLPIYWEQKKNQTAWTQMQLRFLIGSNLSQGCVVTSLVTIRANPLAAIDF